MGLQGLAEEGEGTPCRRRLQPAGTRKGQAANGNVQTGTCKKTTPCAQARNV